VRGKRIAVVGTRSRNTSAAYELVEKAFFEVYEEGDIIVSGGCSKGGDRFAEVIAKQYGIPILIIYPDYRRYKRGAPTVRNGPVAQASDIVIACVRKAEEGIDEVLKRKKGGTEDMLKKFVENKPKERIILV
jgi:hypothetical protein